jgi:hypothetical protein
VNADVPIETMSSTFSSAKKYSRTVHHGETPHDNDRLIEHPAEYYQAIQESTRQIDKGRRMMARHADG